MNASRLFGCHVSSAGGLVNAVKNGALLNVNSIQLHPSPPQRWNTTAHPAEAAEKFIAERDPSKLKKVFFHAVYLINLASPDARQFHLSKTSLMHYLALCGQIKGDGVIFHVGSMKDQEDEKVGYRRAADGVNAALEKASGNALLLLEVAAGSGAVIGDRFEDLAEIYELVDNKNRVGFALDTQHLWASGYDLDTDLDGVIAQADKILGLTKIHAVHLNDSKTAKGSRKDRHENLGDGLIGREVLSRVVNHPKLRDKPFILETPGLKDMETAASEVERLRQMVE
jgi:deoxyribonuclease-4